jgi:SAM-dependent methyltransferase
MRARLRRAFHGVRTEHPGAGRDAAAVALGVFIGCLPVYGFHLLMCWALGLVLRVNRFKVYLAANISNPLVAPWLVLAEIEAGAWLRRGAFHTVGPHAITNAGAARFGGDLVVGSFVVGAALAAVAATHTYAALRGADRDFLAIVRGAADRYVGTSMTAWEFARGKLWNDPIYRATLNPEVLPSGGELLDIGCGQGLTLALLGEARATHEAGRWPRHWPPPPRFERMIGVETRRRAAALAREALASDAEIIQADARALPVRAARAVVLFDVLHLMMPGEQDTLLGTIAGQLEPGGVVLVREADAAAGWRFTAVWLAIRLKALASGSWSQPFHARTETEWRSCFANHGFHVDTRPMGQGTPFANVLFRLTVHASQAECSRPTPDQQPTRVV